MEKIPSASNYVLIDGTGVLGPYVAPELAALVEADVAVLAGGMKAWKANGMPLESGAARLASPPLDRYQRPYEGMDVAPEAMQAYLDWEFGLIEQLHRDGTHHFNPINLKP